MTEQLLDLNAETEPSSLQPLSKPGLPVRRLAPVSRETIVLAGRRAVVEGDPVGGVSRVTIDGTEVPVQPLMDDTPIRSPHPTVVEVGIDRLYRCWSQGPDAFEELWIVPLGLPLAVRRWRWGGRSGGQIVWNPPSDASKAARLLRIAESWPAVDRAWERDVSESATIAGDPHLEEAWSWAKARLLGAVHVGPDKRRVRAGFDRMPPTAVEASWITLGLCALGRSDLAAEAVRKVSDLDLRAHTESWVNRWAGNSGPHPDELAEVFPKAMHMAGRTDTPLNAPPRWHDLSPVTSGAFCGRIVDAGLGVRPDSRFGRVRFGPFQHHLSPETDQPISLLGLTVGRGRGSKRLDFHWRVEGGVGGAATHTFEVVPDAGAIPLQVVFEPRLRAGSIESVQLNGQPVQAEITSPSPGILCARLQCPLDAVRVVAIETAP